MNQNRTGSPSKRNILIATLLLFCISAVVWYRLSANQDAAQNEIKQELKTVGYSARAAIVREISFSDTFNYRGTVEAGKIITLTSETDGKLVFFAGEKGKEVSKGSVLAKIDKSTRLSSFQISTDTYEKSKSDYTKLKELLASGNASGMEVENAKLQMQNAASQLNISRKQVSQTLVLAPETGTIIDKKVNQGEYVSAGSPLGLMACLDKVLVNIFVMENDVALLKKGMQVVVHADAYPGTLYTGKITAIIPVASAAKTFPVEISIVNNKKQRLLAGMTVAVILDPDKKSKALVIPRTALTGDKNQAAVYLIHHSNQPVKTPILLGKTYDTYLAVSQGLKAGDTVMTSGLLNVEPGKKIQWLNVQQ